MPTFGLLLTLAGLFILMIGLIRPKTFAKKGATAPKRWKVFLAGLAATLLGLNVFLYSFFGSLSRSAPTGDEITAPLKPKAEVEPDTQAAVDALTLLLIKRLQSQGSSSATRCTTEIVKGRHFVGCYAHSIGAQGNTALFLIARSGSDKTSVSPINGTAMSQVRNQTSIPTVDGGSLPVASYQGPSIDIPAVLKQFD